MNKVHPIVPDFRDPDGLWAKGAVIEDVYCRTLSKRVWDGMLQRCVPGGHHQKRKPSYVGCVASEEFKDFQYFCDWHRSQVGYGKGYHLDKDLLVPGNKVYGPDRCVLIPSNLNSFFTDRSSCSHLELPVGVCRVRGCAGYRAKIKFDGKMRDLGMHRSKEDAAAAYKKAKEEDAVKWADRLKPPDYFVEQRVIDRLRTWTFPGEIAK